MANAPKKIQVGNICLNIWSNEPKGERKFPTKSISFEKRYQDKEGKWQSSQSYQPNELIKIQIAINEAVRFLFLKEQAEEQAEVPVEEVKDEPEPAKKHSVEEIAKYRAMVEEKVLTPKGFKAITGEAY